MVMIEEVIIYLLKNIYMIFICVSLIDKNYIRLFLKYFILFIYLLEKF